VWSSELKAGSYSTTGYRDGGKALTRTDANEILKRGFGGNDNKKKNWEERGHGRLVPHEQYDQYDECGHQS
jgi:hypothetical protein